MTHSTRPLLGTLLAGLAFAGAAAIPTDSVANGRHGGPGFQGPRIVAPAPAWRVGGPRGGHYRGGGHWHGRGHGWGWGGLALGLGLGALIVTRPWDPVVVERPTYVYVDPPPAPPPPRTGQPVPPAPMAERPADPVIYPSRGQSAEQTEADRQECNRWATTQPAAMADASVFHRATLACLEGRGYTVR